MSDLLKRALEPQLLVAADDVRARGDAAVLEATRRFDGWEPGSAAALGRSDLL